MNISPPPPPEFQSCPDTLTDTKYRWRPSCVAAVILALLLGVLLCPRASADGIKTGIGTSAVPVGGYGGGMVAIHGADDDPVDGPAIQFTTDADDYPVFGIHPAYHSSVALRFNCFYDETLSGAARQRSSSSDPATILSQFEDKFYIYRGNPQSAAANVQLNRVVALQIDLLDGKIKLPEVYSQTSVNTKKQLYVDQYGTLCVASSSQRYKENIRDFTNEDNAWIYALRPRKFDFRAPNAPKNEIGLIAEEVAEVQPDLVIFANAAESNSTPAATGTASAPSPAKARIPESVHYDKLIVPLLAEVQDLRKVVQSLQAQISELEAAK